MCNGHLSIPTLSNALTKHFSNSYKIYKDSDAYKYGYLFSFVTGLGLSHHYPLFVLTLSPFWFHLVIVTPKKSLKEFFTDKRFLYCLFFLGLGLTPSLYLFLPLVFNVDYVFGNLHSFKDIWHHIMRSSYSIVDFQNVSIDDKIAFQKYMFELLWINLRGFLVLVPVGIFISFKKNIRENAVFFISALGTTFILAGILSFPRTSLYLAVFRVYPIPGVLLFAFISAFGLEYLFQKICTK